MCDVWQRHGTVLLVSVPCSPRSSVVRKALRLYVQVITLRTLRARHIARGKAQCVCTLSRLVLDQVASTSLSRSTKALLRQSSRSVWR
jgi:hypothetical protein